MIIKVFSTIYMLLLLLSCSIPSYWNHESWVHTTRKIVHDTEKLGSTSNGHFSKTAIPIRTIFYCIKSHVSYSRGVILANLYRESKFNSQSYYVGSSIFLFLEPCYQGQSVLLIPILSFIFIYCTYVEVTYCQ